MKNALSLLTLFGAILGAGFGQTIDPVGFCATGTSAAACISSFPSGSPNETISVNASGFVMVKNGSGTSNNSWYLLVAVPDYTGGSFGLTQTSGSPAFTQSSVTNAGDWSTSSPQNDVYQFAALTVPGVTDTNASMDMSNMFGSKEAAQLGHAPSFFDVFVYTFTPGFDSNVAYGMSVGGSGLPAGTFLATSGGSQPFSTPFTTTGLVNGVAQTPEPSSILLFGTLGLVVAWIMRRRITL